MSMEPDGGTRWTSSRFDSSKKSMTSKRILIVQSSEIDLCRFCRITNVMLKTVSLDEPVVVRRSLNVRLITRVRLTASRRRLRVRCTNSISSPAFDNLVIPRCTAFQSPLLKSRVYRTHAVAFGLPLNEERQTRKRMTFIHRRTIRSCSA